MHILKCWWRAAGIVAIATLCGCAAPPAPPSVSRAPLQHLVDQIEINQAAIRDGESFDVSTLSDIILKLQAIIDSQPDRETIAAAQFYIGRAADTINYSNLRTGAPIDADLARRAISAYGATIAFGRNIPAWDISILDAEYFAGGSAWRAKNHDAAGEYWRLCATAGHGGCMLALAVNMARDASPASPKLAEAVDLFKAAAHASENYRCAALDADEALAYLIHFHLTKAASGEELTWLKQGRDVWRQLQTNAERDDPCSGASIGIDEFMMRADSGDRQTALLEAARQGSAAPIVRAIAEYLEGALDKPSLRAKLSVSANTPSRRCEVHFFELWNDVQAGRTAAAREDYALMLKLGAENCSLMLLYAKQLGLGGDQDRPGTSG
jgi:hypothetical protein